MNDRPPPLFETNRLGARRDRAMRRGFLEGADFLWARAAEALAERLDDTPRRFPRIAVLGTGAGHATAALGARAAAADLTLVDPSAAMLERAGAAAPDAGRLHDPCEVLPLAEGSVDLALSLFLLHWQNDPIGHLVQLRRALAPDGLMLGCLLGGGTLAALRDAFVVAEAEALGGVRPHVAPMADLRALGAALQRAGFAMPVADVETVTVRYGDVLALMRDLRAMGETSLLAGRSRAPLRRAVLAQAAAQYASRCGSGDGGVEARFDLMFLSGWAPGPDQPQAKRPGSAKARLADALGTLEIPTGDKPGRES
ncbi:MAG: methyltransferase domain-containing protein [Pseudomonadota bacterium]